MAERADHAQAAFLWIPSRADVAKIFQIPSFSWLKPNLITFDRFSDIFSFTRSELRPEARYMQLQPPGHKMYDVRNVHCWRRRSNFSKKVCERRVDCGNGDVLAVNATGAVVSMMYGTVHAQFALSICWFVGRRTAAGLGIVVVWERIKSMHTVVHQCNEEISTQLIGWVRSCTDRIWRDSA